MKRGKLRNVDKVDKNFNTNIRALLANCNQIEYYPDLFSINIFTITYSAIYTFVFKSLYFDIFNLLATS